MLLVPPVLFPPLQAKTTECDVKRGYKCDTFGIDKETIVL